MKKIIFLIFLLQKITAFSQVDAGSNSLSVAITAQYGSLFALDKFALEKIVSRLSLSYAERLPYLESSRLIVIKIKQEIIDTRSRYTALKNDNNRLTFFSYSKKKTNTKTLDIINSMLSNIENELNKQESIHVLYGEKLNLYQNTMESFFQIHRLMDTVEDAIGQSKLLNILINR